LFIEFFNHFFCFVFDLLNHFQHANWIIYDSKNQSIQDINENRILLLWIFRDKQNIEHEAATILAYIRIDNVLNDRLRCSDSKWLLLTRHDECRISISWKSSSVFVFDDDDVSNSDSIWWMILFLTQNSIIR
jgi:hypothetical protein